MKIRVNEAVYLTLCPDRFRLDSMRYHGISADNLKDSQCFADAAPQLLSALDGILLGYCIELDYRFLQRFFAKTGTSFTRKLVDILLIEKWIVDQHGRRKADENLSLDNLLKRYGLREIYRHNALADAFFTAQIFQIQVMKYNIETLEQLMDIQRICSTAECAFLV